MKHFKPVKATGLEVVVQDNRLIDSPRFLSLQEHFVEMENRLQAARRAYNSNIKILRDKKETFPSNIVASFMTIKDYAMFEADFKAKNEKISVKDIYEN